MTRTPASMLGIRRSWKRAVRTHGRRRRECLPPSSAPGERLQARWNAGRGGDVPFAELAAEALEDLAPQVISAPTR